MGAETEKDEHTAASSTATDEQTQQGAKAESPTASAGENGPESPTGDTQDNAGEQSYEDGLMAAIAEAADTPEGDSSDTKAESGDDSEGDGEAGDDDGQSQDDEQDQEDQDSESAETQTDEDGKDLPPFHKHPRWQEMVRERNQLRDQVEHYKTDADEYGKVREFMEQNGLTGEEVAKGIQVVAMMRNDPFRAREFLSRELDQLDSFTGHKLPDDLQQEVDQGLVSEDRARELAQLRSRQQFTSQQAQQERERARQVEQQRQQEEQQRNQQQTLADAQSAVRSWQQRIQSRDPDFQSIYPFVFDRLSLLAQQEPPQSADHAVQLAEKAYDYVKKQTRSMGGGRQETAPSPSSKQAASAASGGSAPASFTDAVMQAANG